MAKSKRRQSELKLNNIRDYVAELISLLDDLNSGDPEALERLREHVGWDKEFEPPTLGDLIAWDLGQYYAMEQAAGNHAVLDVLVPAPKKQRGSA